MIRLWVDYILASDVFLDDTQIILRDTTALLAGGGRIRIGGEVMIYSAITAAATTEDPNRGILDITDRGVDFTPRLRHLSDEKAFYLVPSTAYSGISWPGRVMHFDAIVSSSDISFWPPTTSMWSLDGVDHSIGKFIDLPDGAFLIKGVTLTPTSINYSIQLLLGTAACADSATLDIGILVGEFCSMYVGDDGSENGADFTDSLVPATPTTVLAGNIRTITIDLDAGGGLVNTTQYVSLKSYCTHKLITKVSIDWDDGGPVEDFLLDGSAVANGLGTAPTRQIDARFSHAYTTDATRTIIIEIHDSIGLVDTRNIGVVIARTVNYSVDQILLQRRSASTGDVSFVHKSDTVHDWIEPPSNDDVSDVFLPAGTFQYRLKVRRFTIDGRARVSGPVEVTSNFSSWSAAV